MPLSPWKNLPGARALTNVRLPCRRGCLRSFDSGDLAVHLDGSLGFREQGNHLGVVLQAFHGVREEFLEPAGVLKFNSRKILNSRFEILRASPRPGLEASTQDE